MTSCYFCGCSIRNGEGYRRKVLTSESTRVYITKRGGGSYGQTYALRTLCASCSAQLDERNKRLSWQLPVSIVAGLIGTIMAVRWAVADSSTPSGLGSLIYAFFLFGGLGLVTYFGLKLLTGNDAASSSTPSYSNYQEEASTSVARERIEHPSAQDRDEVNEDFSFYIDSIKEIATDFNDIGISFFGCYGFEISQENLEPMVDKVFENMPPNHYPSKSDWKKAVAKNSYNVFIDRATKAIEHNNPEDFDLDTLLLVFPGREIETIENYILRIQNATKVAFERSQS